MLLAPLLSHRSIRTKLLFLLLPPLLGLLYLSAALLLAKSRAVDNLAALQAQVRLTVKNSAAIHEIQKERGLSSGFIASGGTRFVAEVGDQRRLTDSKLAELKAYMDSLQAADGEVTVHGHGTALPDPTALAGMRSAVSALSVPAKDAFGYYTGLIDSLLNISANVSKAGNSDQIGQATLAYYLFLNGKERAGRERATLNGVFSADRFEPETLQRFITLVASEETYFNLFTTYAPAEVMPFYEAKMAGDYSASVASMRRLALDRAQAGLSASGFGVEPGQWFGAISAKINAMKEVEDRLAARLDNQIDGAIGEARRQFWLVAGLTLAIVAATLFLSWQVAGCITRPAGALHAVMMKLHESNDLGLRCQIYGRDEIGQTAEAFNVMIGDFQQIVGAIHDNAERVAAASERLAGAAEQVSRSSAAQNEAAAASAAALEEMNASAASVTENAQEVAGIAQDTLARTTQGTESVAGLIGAIGSAEEAMGSIAGSIEEFIQDVNNISQLTQQVRDIAEQTNLLALNAAIEAARAGDQGRGFAVVADEVRKLAEKSARSANEIDEVTQMVNQHSGVVKGAMQQGATALQSSQEGVEDVATVLSGAAGAVERSVVGVGHITAAIREQNATIADTAAGVERIAHMAEANNRAVAQVSGSAQDLRQLSLALREAVGKFS